MWVHAQELGGDRAEVLGRGRHEAQLRRVHRVVLGAVRQRPGSNSNNTTCSIIILIMIIELIVILIVIHIMIIIVVVMIDRGWRSAAAWRVSTRATSSRRVTAY